MPFLTATVLVAAAAVSTTTVTLTGGVLAVRALLAGVPRTEPTTHSREPVIDALIDALIDEDENNASDNEDGYSKSRRSSHRHRNTRPTSTTANAEPARRAVYYRRESGREVEERNAKTDAHSMNSRLRLTVAPHIAAATAKSTSSRPSSHRTYSSSSSSSSRPSLSYSVSTRPTSVASGMSARSARYASTPTSDCDDAPAYTMSAGWSGSRYNTLPVASTKPRHSKTTHHPTRMHIIDLSDSDSTYSAPSATATTPRYMPRHSAVAAMPIPGSNADPHAALKFRPIAAEDEDGVDPLMAPARAILEGRFPGFKMSMRVADEELVPELARPPPPNARKGCICHALGRQKRNEPWRGCNAHIPPTPVYA